MKPSLSSVALARKIFAKQSDQILRLSDFLNPSFEEVTDLMYRCKGRLVVTGMGKSALIAQKISATLNSTGTPALFMHSADALHGDLGMVQRDDMVLCLSNSGNTPEIKKLVFFLKNFEVPLVAICASETSYLGLNADHILKCTVDEESIPGNFAPTSSTMAQLLLGDALAVCLQSKRNFTPEDFAKFHPGGSLGRQLYTRVEDVLEPTDLIVRSGKSLSDVIVKITSNRMGVAIVLGDEDQVLGIITDGDLRRMLLKGLEHLTGVTAEHIMSTDPKSIAKEARIGEALSLMKQSHITSLVVLDDGRYFGVIHMHQILKYEN